MTYVNLTHGRLEAIDCDLETKRQKHPTGSAITISGGVNNLSI